MKFPRAAPPLESKDRWGSRHLRVLHLRLCALAVAVFALAGRVAAPEPQAGREPSEYEIKAAYLYNFARFVEWPPEPSGGSGNSFVIGVIGDDAFCPILDKTVSGRTVNNRAFMVRRLQWPADLKGVHILFISSSVGRSLSLITAGVRNAPVLTVTESERITQAGSVVNFVMEAGKVRFEVDMDAAEKAGLKISSKLLMLARVYRNRRTENGD